jgi:hypothetical protein
VTTAVAKLNPQSQLSDQLELLADDLTLDGLASALPDNVQAQLLESVTAAEISRTIEGASTLTITVLDRDRALLESGHFGDGLDINLDGLWFSLVAIDLNDVSLTLTFEDREVALLRKYPLSSAPMHGRLLQSVHDTTRLAFARRLVVETARESHTPIRFNGDLIQAPILSSSDRPTKSEKVIRRGYGFAPGDKITVQHVAATREQKDNTERVLDVGVSMNVPSILLVAAVMVINDESGAVPKLGFVGSCANNGQAVGIFQQCPGGGRPDGKGVWPATFDIEEEARAFFEVAMYEVGVAATGQSLGKPDDSPGPAQGLSVYVAEYITRYADWKPGMPVDSSTVLCYFVPGITFSGNGIETGWAQPGTGQPMALPVYPGGGRMTAFGVNFSELLASLNPRNAGRAEHPPPVGTLPADWPNWKRAPQEG